MVVSWYYYSFRILFWKSELEKWLIKVTYNDIKVNERTYESTNESTNERTYESNNKLKW